MTERIKYSGYEPWLVQSPMNEWFAKVQAVVDHYAPGAGWIAKDGKLVILGDAPVVKISKGEAERRQAVEKAYELGVLQREHPDLYAELVAAQTRKADIVSIGRADVLHRMEAKVQAYINSHRPTPTRAKPGEKPTPIGIVPTKEQAWAALMRDDPEFAKLYAQYSGR